MRIPRVSIEILQRNRWEDTIECLESIFRTDYPNYDVVVVDNCSTDDSVQRIKEYAEGSLRTNSKFFAYNKSNKPIKVFEISEGQERVFGKWKKRYESLPPDRRLVLLKNKKNYFYAGGHNRGISFSLEFLQPEYILMLNQDMVVDKNALNELVKFARENNAEIISPKIYYYDFQGRTDVISFIGEGEFVAWKGRGKRYGDGEVDCGQWDKPMRIDRTEGTGMFVSSKVFRKIGFLDESYYFFWEETDFCIRAKKAGFEIMYCPNAKMWHKAPVGSWMNPFRAYNLTRSRMIFVKKNFPAELWKHLLFLVYDAVLFTGSLFYRGRSLSLLFPWLKGVIDGYRFNPDN